MEQYRIIIPIVLSGLFSTSVVQASQVDIELGCVSVANKDVSITTGECVNKRVETVKVIKVVEERKYHTHPVHGKHPGKKKGHFKEKYTDASAHKHKH